MPHRAAGIRIEPPPSLPVARVQSPATTDAPAPPLDPPVVRSVFHGFRQWSPRRFCVWPSSPNSGVFVLPSTTAPDAFTRSTTAESTTGTRFSKSSEPPVVRIPADISRSLTDMGTPWSGPSSSPLITASSAAWASARALSAATVRYEFILSSRESMRSRNIPVNSTGESSRSAISRRTSVAGANARLSSMVAGVYQGLWLVASGARAGVGLHKATSHARLHNINLVEVICDDQNGTYILGAYLPGAGGR